MRIILKKMIPFCLLIFIFTACGMTEELDQAKDNLEELQEITAKQSEHYKEINKQHKELKQIYTDEAKMKQTLPLFSKKKGELYANYKARQRTFKKMQTYDEEVEKIKNDIDRIYKKAAVDIPHDELKTIAQSIEIIHNNFKAYEILIESGLKQEEKLYQNPPEKKLDQQLYFIERTYASAQIISEEARTNISYTTSIASNFESILNKQ